ncbi:3'(2'),5'-bisphosphate nucleotidase CysQ [Cycloclasticus zancles]|jgi:3'(2'), 5'-bisphosphate nucleotidase|uniref:3'(2'),5'-bisphosphate nucleotidase CysQ n=1 Tax=Cycloclasticus zancles 78-ME TaxID=1198232 RepID=S5TUT8_9GAMM|nr:3'(2'),5'-bisphosphate nucleotidase CysQ [Cycloclasticus zancles]AGS38778.1 3'(2'),5'-bisphosphate nucleotidase [Cycloclasticus zancles 78-ME]
MLDNINIEDIVALAKKAGDAIMDIYQKDFEVEFKADQSPLTEADTAAHKIIEQGLKELDQKNNRLIPLMSEEGKNIPYQNRKDWDYFWMVDPVDGTKEFIKKNGEFTVNIALINQGMPVLGVVYAPALGQMYWAKQGEGAFKDGQALPLKRAEQRDSYKVVASRSHLSDETKIFIDEIKTEKVKELVSIGSSLKLCLVAEGEADIYPRLGPTMEWDTAAAHAVVLCAGMKVCEFNKGEISKPLVYNKQNLLNPFFIVSSIS